MARNRTEPAGLMPGRPDEGVWAYMWPPRRGHLHAINPKTGLIGTPASGSTCFVLKAQFPAYYAGNPDQPRAHQSHGVKLRNGRAVVLDDHGFGVRRDELEFAIYHHHRVKGRAGRHTVEGDVQ